MGFGTRVRALFSRTAAPTAQSGVRTFAMQPVMPVDQLLAYMWAKTGTVGRAAALGVPAVLRGRNMICAISTLPLQEIDAKNRVQDSPLLSQLDPNVPNVVVLAQTLEDLFFESVAWWRVTGFDRYGRPASIRRYEPGTVSLQAPDGYQEGYLPSGLPTHGVVWMEGKAVAFSDVIRFDSPNPALLVAGQDPIRRSIALDRAADMYATQRRMRGFFTPKEGVDPAGDDVIADLLDDWQTSRQNNLDGYVPAALDYNQVQDPNPAELQLIQQQQRNDLGLANAMGLDPEDLGINTTSRTYQNAVDRRKDRVNDVLAAYMRAITDRLSMPDVTRRGFTVRFSLDDFLKADPKTRAEVQQIYSNMGVTDAEEIREAEGLPPKVILRPATPPAVAAPGAPVHVPSQVGAPVPAQHAIQAHADLVRFAAGNVTHLDFQADGQFAVDVDARTITGLAVPWGQNAVSDGRRYRFARGALVWSAVNRVKLLRDHVMSSALGRAVSLENTDVGLVAKFKVSAGLAGDGALALAADEVLDGLSVGAEWRPEDVVPDPQFPGGWLVTKAALREISLTAMPAFDDSRLTSVRASLDGGPMKFCATCGATLTDGVAHTCTPPTPDPNPAPNVPATEPAAAAVTFSADQFGQFMQQFGQPVGDPRPTVDPTTGTPPTAVTAVTEPLPYRFSYSGGKTTFEAAAKHDFSTDLFTVMDANKPGPERAAAEQRVNGLIKAAFATVATGDVTAINPTRHRPDLWQAQMDFATPLWDMVAAGTTDGSKFDVPKYNSSSNLVQPATEGVEPAPGAFTATLQTITPTQVWGKVEISRQAWRAGGTPQLSGILWDQMLREYYEDREAAVATFLNTLTAAADITITGTPAASPTNDSDQASAQSLEAAIALLQFARGGNRFRAFAVHQNLYKVLARVTDDAGRPLYPMLNPSNANGTAANLFGTLNVAGTTAVPSWALGGDSGTAPANSWLFDPTKVLGWAGAPERMFWDFGATIQTLNIPQLSYVTLGIYGDVAMANLDINGVRQVIFDPSV